MSEAYAGSSFFRQNWRDSMIDRRSCGACQLDTVAAAYISRPTHFATAEVMTGSSTSFAASLVTAVASADIEFFLLFTTLPSALFSGRLRVSARGLSLALSSVSAADLFRCSSVKQVDSSFSFQRSASICRFESRRSSTSESCQRSISTDTPALLASTALGGETMKEYEPPEASQTLLLPGPAVVGVIGAENTGAICCSMSSGCVYSNATSVSSTSVVDDDVKMTLTFFGVTAELATTARRGRPSQGYFARTHSLAARRTEPTALVFSTCRCMRPRSSARNFWDRRLGLAPFGYIEHMAARTRPHSFKVNRAPGGIRISVLKISPKSLLRRKSLSRWE
mmetsp:Transcript_10369/g.31714  ORF Transcript_10369/g.31714 Transcript_10369/m.31714 type:complete len:338 (-) Transcript_10369:694-1707(-)